MTEQSNAELIAENRKWVRLHQANKYQAEAARRMAQVLDALEAAEKGWDADVERLAEAHNARIAAEKRAEEAEAAEKRWEDRAYIYATERDQLAAVVEKVRGVGEKTVELIDVLATAPADALRELKAEAWEEGFNRSLGDGEPINPYREERA